MGSLEADAAEAGFPEVFENHAAGAGDVDASAGEDAAPGAGGEFDEFIAPGGTAAEAIAVLKRPGIAPGQTEKDAGGEFMFGEDGFLDGAQGGEDVSGFGVFEFVGKQAGGIEEFESRARGDAAQIPGEAGLGAGFGAAAAAEGVDDGGFARVGYAGDEGAQGAAGGKAGGAAEFPGGGFQGGDAPAFGGGEGEGAAESAAGRGLSRGTGCGPGGRGGRGG